MPTVEVNGARLWYDEAGSGPTLLLLHGGLGDSGLWEPVVPFLAERFRTIRTDLRFFGRSTGPAAPWSWQDDSIGDIDAMREVALDPWAPLGVAAQIRRLWHATPDANPMPEGVEPLPAPGSPAKERLGELSVPTLVITASHDPEGFREIGPIIAAE